MLKGLVIWHYYKEGKIVGASTTEFEGTVEQLKEMLDRDGYGKKRMPDEQQGTFSIPQQVLLFQ